MAAVLTGAGVWADRRRRVAELRARHGFARQLLDFYGALIGVQQKAFEDALAAPPSPDALAAYAAELVVPSIVDVSVAVGPDRLRAEVIRHTRSGDARETVRRWIESADQPPVGRFLARASLGPVLEALGPDARAVCAGPRDARHCPDCGGPPQVSSFVPASDDLATGPRELVCARCGRSWGYPRMTCADCGEDSSAKLNVFGERGTTSGERGSVVRGLPTGPSARRGDAIFPHMRIEACDSCRRYVLTVDLAVDPAAVPLVDEMAAVPLDLFARERGYAKVTSNLMGF